VHGKDNASIADPYQTVAVDVMDARETQELTLTARLPKTKEREKKAAIASGRLSRQLLSCWYLAGYRMFFVRRVIN
jgi:hypothetical protein